MKLIPAASYRLMPWKNGGGFTAEIHVAGPDATNFDWRVSIATVSSDGPFSRFAGYDRHIMTIAGAGMILDGGPDGPIIVAPTFKPCRFSGDWRIDGRLIDGPARDFNLIVKAASFESSLEVHWATNAPDLAAGNGWLVIHVLEGEVSGTGGLSVPSGDSLILAPGERLRLHPVDAVRLALARVLPRAT